MCRGVSFEMVNVMVKDLMLRNWSLFVVMNIVVK